MVMDKRSGEAKVAAAAQTQTRPSSLNRPLPPPPPLQPRAPPQPPLLAHPRFEPVDCEKTCPLLLRVLTKIGSHHNEEDFAVRGKEPKDEVQIYTRKDATPREITDLVKEVAPEARRRNANFAFVYPDQRGRFVLRTWGLHFLMETGDEWRTASHWVNLLYQYNRYY